MTTLTTCFDEKFSLNKIFVKKRFYEQKRCISSDGVVFVK